MAQRKAPKNISLLRAVYPTGGDILQGHINDACVNVPALDQREVAHPTHGSLRINHYDVGNQGLVVHVVAKTSGEAASTVEDMPGAINNAEVDVPPPQNRSFKSADLFALIDGNSLCICTDGIRVAAFEKYLKAFFVNAGLPNSSVQFDLTHVQNVEKVAALSRGGVKEIQLSGTLYNATARALHDASMHDGAGISKIMSSVKNQLAALFDTDDDQELAENSGDIHVDVVVRASGGMRAEPAVLKKMVDVGVDLVEESDSAGYVIVTNNNRRMTPDELVVVYPTVLERGESTNSIQRPHAYDKLYEAMEKFRRDGDLEV